MNGMDKTMVHTMQSKRQMSCVFIMLLLITGCSKVSLKNTDNSINYSLEPKVEEQSDEIEFLKELNEKLVNENIMLLNELEALKADKFEYELIIKEQREQLIERKDNIKLERINVKDLHLDGEPLWNYEKYSAFKVENQLYVSAQLIRDYYNLEDNGYNHVDDILIKGRPIEDKVFKVDRVISFDNLGDIIGEKEFKEAQSIEETSIFDLQGIEIEVDQRFVTYTITSSNYMTEKGITIGASKQEVREVYGDIGEMDSDEWFTCKTSADVCKIYFTFEDNELVSIRQRIR